MRNCVASSIDARMRTLTDLGVMLSTTCSFRTQLPVFVTSVWAIRRMCMAEWPGLADGGVLWFEDLTLPALDVSTATAPMGRYRCIPECSTRLHALS